MMMRYIASLFFIVSFIDFKCCHENDALKSIELRRKKCIDFFKVKRKKKRLYGHDCVNISIENIQTFFSYE